MIFFFLGVLVVAGAIAMFSDWGRDANKKRKEKQEFNYINDNKEALFQQRVKQLGINLNDAIEVLHFPDPNDRTDGFYRHMWYENGAIGIITSTRAYNGEPFYGSPLEWKVTWIECNNIEGLYKRGNACRLTYKTDKGLTFDGADYDKIKQLFEKNNIECKYS